MSLVTQTLPHAPYTGDYHAELVFADVLSSALSGDGRRDRPKTFDDLDWDVVCQRVADHCMGPDAGALAAELGLLPDRDAVERRRAEVAELADVQVIEGPPPLGGIDQIGSSVRHATKGEVLQPDALYAIAKTALAAERVRGFITQHEAQLPLLNEHVARMEGTGSLAREILGAVDATGGLMDSASPELRRLRRAVVQLQESLRSKLDAMVRSEALSGILQDDYVTIREGRYVLPVRAGERGDFPGIVHGHSASGATLFIEPETLIPVNNQLRIAQMEVGREEHRILSALSDGVRRSAAALELNADILTYIDLTQAAVRFGLELGAALPTLVDADGTAWGLKQARHPVLALRARREGFTVVPNDIGLPAGAQALVVSGPNTGGKTVTLKTVGMASLLTRAGLPVPCDAGSSLPYFETVFTDVGDEQTVERDLSTFSGHVANIASFLAQCERGTLVLLDELFAGTDPGQGAALGRALLSTLVAQGATTLVTTHLEPLKGLGFEDRRFAAASVGFDVERLAPTFELRPGVPGSSYAFRIAGRLGLDPGVIRDAEALMTQVSASESETVLQRMEVEYQKLRAARERARIAADEAQRHERALERAKQRVLDGTDKELGQSIKQMQREASALRDELKRLNKEAKRLAKSARLDKELPQLAAAREASRKVAAKAQQLASSRRSRMASGRVGLERSALTPGLVVWVETFGRTGEVAEVPPSGKIPVQLGAIRASFDVKDLYEASQRSGSKSAGQRSEPARREPAVTIQRGQRDTSNTLDLRGERVEGAIEQLEAHLERAVLEDLAALSIVHGHGTGALKKAVRELVARHPSVSSWRPGERGEGGDGVTILEIQE